MHCPRHGPRESQVVAVLGTVRIHRSQEDLPRAERLQTCSPLHCCEPGGLTTAPHHHLPPFPATARESFWVFPSPFSVFRVHRGHHALTAELVGEPRDERRISHGRGIDSHLVGSRPQHDAGVRDAPDPAAHGEREDRKSTRLNSSHGYISYAVFCLKKKKSQ